MRRRGFQPKAVPVPHPRIPLKASPLGRADKGRLIELYEEWYEQGDRPKP